MLFKTKKGINLEDLKSLQPGCWILFSAVLLYCHRNNLTCRITSIIGDRKNINAKSTTHEEGRAIDIGIRKEDGWNDVHIQRLAYFISRDYEEIGALSASDLCSRPIIIKPDHLHLQVRPNLDVSKFIKE